METKNTQDFLLKKQIHKEAIKTSPRTTLLRRRCGKNSHTNFKALKTILTLIIVSFVLSSCASNENKALNYVTIQVLPKDSINTFLIAYTAQKYNNSFWENLESYINSILSTNPFNKRLHSLNLSGGWGNYNKQGYSEDKFTTGSRYGETDSFKILQTIYQTVTEAISEKDENNTEVPPLGWGLWDEFDWYNSVILECTNKTYIIDNRDEWYNSRNYKKYKYEWVAKSDDERSEFIDELASFLVSSAIDWVNENEFKIIDAQGIKIDENKYKVIYLLEPKLKIVFNITKVGDTFCCDNINVEGEIIINGRDINYEESPL